MTPRKKPAIRRAEILDAAVQLAVSSGYLTLTREAVADAVGVSGPAVHYHFGTMRELRQAVVTRAVEDPVLEIIGQLIVARDPAADQVPAAVRAGALAVLRG